MLDGGMMQQIFDLADWYCGDHNCFSVAEMLETCMSRGIEIMLKEMEAEKEAQERY